MRTHMCSLGRQMNVLRHARSYPRNQAVKKCVCIANNGRSQKLSSVPASFGAPGVSRCIAPNVRASGVGGGASGSQFSSTGGGSPPRKTPKGDGGGGGGGSGGGDRGPWSFYLKALESNPIITKAITASVLNAIGDLACQVLVEKNENINWRRFAIFATMGLLMIGPVLHYWYGFNQALISAPGLKGGLMRMAIDQLFFAPVFVATCFSTLFLLEGKPKAIPDKLKSDLKPAVLANWKLWVPAQTVNFVFVPPPLRVAFSSCVSLVWNVYLSFASNNKLAEAA